MSKAGAAIWDEIAPVCLAMGTLTTADVVAFASMCELQATMREASAAKDGRQLFQLVKGDDDPRLEVVIDSVLRLERDTAGALRPYYDFFGLNPVSRAKIAVPKAPEQKSKWAQIGLA
jgi:P27 family predicted phage terminase small subunit